MNNSDRIVPHHCGNQSIIIYIYNIKINNIELCNLQKLLPSVLQWEYIMIAQITVKNHFVARGTSTNICNNLTGCIQDAVHHSTCFCPQAARSETRKLTHLLSISNSAVVLWQQNTVLGCRKGKSPTFQVTSTITIKLYWRWLSMTATRRRLGVWCQKVVQPMSSSHTLRWFHLHLTRRIWLAIWR